MNKKYKQIDMYEYVFENKKVRLLVILEKRLPKNLLLFAEIIWWINLILDHIKDYWILYSSTTLK